MFGKRLQVFIRSAPTSGSVGPEADATDTFYTNWNWKKLNWMNLRVLESCECV